MIDAGTTSFVEEGRDKSLYKSCLSCNQLDGSSIKLHVKGLLQMYM
jgi:hypothetical protein